MAARRPRQAGAPQLMPRVIQSTTGLDRKSVVVLNRRKTTDRDGSRMTHVMSLVRYSQLLPNPAVLTMRRDGHPAAGGVRSPVPKRAVEAARSASFFWSPFVCGSDRAIPTNASKINN